MAAIDRLYTDCPFYGSRRIVKKLNKTPEWKNVTRKRVSRLMRRMGIEAIYPKPRLSKPNKDNGKYPYLLSGLSINHPNQVWSTDITYIPTAKGFVYLAAIIDWYSRYVLSWELSNSMESSFCIKALERAIAIYGTPEIFNTDQGSQFTDHRFTGILEKNGIRISMDGKGRCLDNVFIERLWRTVKYEEVYIKGYETLSDARAGLKKYFWFYNNDRLHQSLDYKTPSEVYLSTGGKRTPPEAGAISLKSVA
jgi:putative transposase